MIHREASLLLSAILASLPAAEILGGALDPVEHRLLLASVFLDDCKDCDRPSVPETISGTFLLTPEEPAPLDFDIYRVENVELRTRADRPGGEIVFRGGGTYRVNTRLGEHVMRLELEASGHGAVVLDSGPVARPEGSEETIDITVREEGSRDPLHVFSIRIVSAPAPVDAVPYELLPGSKVFIDCWVCELVSPERPIVGTFLLEKTSSDPDPVARYRIWDLAFRTDDGVYQGVADGVYTQGGQVAIVQMLELEARWIDDTLTTGLEGGPGPVAVTFPAIDARRCAPTARILPPTVRSSYRGSGSSPGPRRQPPRTGGAIRTPTARSTSRTAFTSSSGASPGASRLRAWMRQTRTTTRGTTSPTPSSSSTSSSSGARRRPFPDRAHADRLQPRAAAAPRTPVADLSYPLPSRSRSPSRSGEGEARKLLAKAPVTCR